MDEAPAQRSRAPQAIAALLLLTGLGAAWLWAQPLLRGRLRLSLYEIEVAVRLRSDESWETAHFHRELCEGLVAEGALIRRHFTISESGNGVHALEALWIGHPGVWYSETEVRMTAMTAEGSGAEIIVTVYATPEGAAWIEAFVTRRRGASAQALEAGGLRDGLEQGLERGGRGG